MKGIAFSGISAEADKTQAKIEAMNAHILFISEILKLLLYKRKVTIFSEIRVVSLNSDRP